MDVKLLAKMMNQCDRDWGTSTILLEASVK